MSSHFTELPPEEVAEPFPCSSLMHWPGYDTKIFETTLDGRSIVIQLWKGYCPSYMPGMVGGFGAEVGIYYKSWQPGMWWPDHQHEKRISFKLIYPSSNRTFFSATAKRCWWRHKWMTEASYVEYLKNHPNAPLNPTDYRLDFTIEGSRRTIHQIW